MLFSSSPRPDTLVAKMPGGSAGGVDVGSLNYREMQNLAKEFGRTDSGNHQLVPSNVKKDALRANLASVLAERSVNQQQPPPAASPSPTKPKRSPKKSLGVAALGAQLNFNPAMMMMGGPRPGGGIGAALRGKGLAPTVSAPPQPLRKLEHPTLKRARRSVRRSQPARRRRSSAATAGCVHQVVEAILEMKHRGGSSRAQIAAHIEAMHGVAPAEIELNMALKQDTFLQHNGLFKLSEDYVPARRPRSESLVESMKAVIEEEPDEEGGSDASAGQSLVERMKAAKAVQAGAMATPSAATEPSTAAALQVEGEASDLDDDFVAFASNYHRTSGSDTTEATEVSETPKAPEVSEPTETATAVVELAMEATAGQETATEESADAAAAAEAEAEAQAKAEAQAEAQAEAARLATEEAATAARIAQEAEAEAEAKAEAARIAAQEEEARAVAAEAEEEIRLAQEKATAEAARIEEEGKAVAALAEAARMEEEQAAAAAAEAQAQAQAEEAARLATEKEAEQQAAAEAEAEAEAVRVAAEEKAAKEQAEAEAKAEAEAVAKATAEVEAEAEAARAAAAEAEVADIVSEIAEAAAHAIVLEEEEEEAARVAVAIEAAAKAKAEAEAEAEAARITCMQEQAAAAAAVEQEANRVEEEKAAAEAAAEAEAEAAQIVEEQAAAAAAAEQEIIRVTEEKAAAEAEAEAEAARVAKENAEAEAARIAAAEQEEEASRQAAAEAEETAARIAQKEQAALDAAATAAADADAAVEDEDEEEDFVTPPPRACSQLPSGIPRLRHLWRLENEQKLTSPGRGAPTPGKWLGVKTPAPPAAAPAPAAAVIEKDSPAAAAAPPAAADDRKVKKQKQQKPRAQQTNKAKPKTTIKKTTSAGSANGSSGGTFVVNTCAAKGGTLAMLNTLGDTQPAWKLHDGKDSNNKAAMRGSAFWVVTAEDAGRILSQKKPNQRLNRIPGAVELCRKVPFTQLMRKQAELGSDASSSSGVDSWYPQSWIIPGEEQDSELQAALKDAATASSGSTDGKAALILKPDGGHQGDGIYLITSAASLERRMPTLQQAHGESSAILQRYVAEPMLLGGKKFDLRLYVLVLSLSPLRVFVCKEGLVRCCTVDYEPVSAGNEASLSMHLTNYAVNKFDPSYQHAPTAGEQQQQGEEASNAGSKRTLSSVLSQLESEQGVDSTALWSRICDMLKESAGALTTSLIDTISNNEAGSDDSSSGVRQASVRDCFQLFGFDVLLDKEGNPHLLEVNDKPAMGYDSVQPLTDTAADTADSSNRCCPAVDESADVSAAGLRLKAAGRECKCAAHPRVHVHRPCSVDLAVKTVSPVLLSTLTGRHGHTHTHTPQLQP